jgi:(S)-mandelate dehydrogenase
MDQIEHLKTESPMTQPARRSHSFALREYAAIAALAVGAAGAAVRIWGSLRRSAAASGPADKTLASRSPAVLSGGPRRRFYAGRDPARAITIEDLRAMAQRRLPRFALEYLEGGSEDGATLARNAAALAEWHFLHRSLVDVSRRDVSTLLFGGRLAMPLAIGPTGLNGLFWPHADLRLAEAAAAAGIPFAQSTMSNDAMDRIARVPGLRYWWQLYVFGPPQIRERLIDRARDCGCEALIVTTDAQIYGNREWQKRTQSSPKALTWSATFDALLHPRWFAQGILTHGMPRFENVIEFVPEHRCNFFDSADWIRSQMDQALSWDTVARIRERWPRKLVVKGLLSVEDIERAVAIGADAVAISNHGGRQLDWAIAPLDILPAARDAVGQRIAILVDGGMRRGTDIIKALILGADAVLIGRAALYGVAAAGMPGVKRALDILREELDRDLGLLGAASLAGLSRQLVVRRRPKSSGCRNRLEPNLPIAVPKPGRTRKKHREGMRNDV